MCIRDSRHRLVRSPGRGDAVRRPRSVVRKLMADVQSHAMTIDLATLDGGSHRLSQQELDGFRARFRGSLIKNGDPGYDEVRQVWNAMIDRRPALIARCTGTADVVAAVQLARTHRLLSSVRGGGHNIAGLAVCEGGLLIDLSLM